MAVRPSDPIKIQPLFHITIASFTLFAIRQKHPEDPVLFLINLKQPLSMIVNDSKIQYAIVSPFLWFVLFGLNRTCYYFVPIG